MVDVYCFTLAGELLCQSEGSGHRGGDIGECRGSRRVGVKAEVDQLIKKHEVEKKHHGLLIDNLKNRVYQLENTVQEMSRVIKILNQNSVSPNPVHN